jgi:hypothetical protein
MENRLGAAVQLCALPWLGWVPDDLAGCPVAAARRLAAQLQLADEDVLGLLSAYGGWEGRTRRDHRALVLDRLSWRASGAADRKQLDASCSLMLWNTTHPVCCSRWGATGCATSGSSARGGSALCPGG